MTGGAPDFQRSVALANVDTLASAVAITPSTAVQTTALGTAKHNYAGLQVHKYGTITDIGATPIAFRANNTTTGETGQWQTTPPSVQPMDLWLPLACNVGDTVTLDWITTQNGVTAMHFSAYGLVTIPANAPRLRPDGLLYPIGVTGVFAQLGGAGTANLVAAPPAGWNVLIKQAMVFSGGGAGYANLILNLNGPGNTLLLTVQAAGQSQSDHFLEGILCDAQSAVQYSGPAAGSGAGIVYDIVRSQK